MAEYSILNVSRRGFGNLFQTYGRDSRMQFWLFGALVFAPLMTMQFVVQIVLTFPSLQDRSEEHTSELQSLMRISYAVFCLKKKTNNKQHESFNMIQYNKTQVTIM